MDRLVRALGFDREIGADPADDLVVADESGVISLATIRGKDFVAQSGPAVADG